jgi:hypothetical protein
MIPRIVRQGECLEELAHTCEARHSTSVAFALDSSIISSDTFNGIAGPTIRNRSHQRVGIAVQSEGGNSSCFLASAARAGCDHASEGGDPKEDLRRQSNRAGLGENHWISHSVVNWFVDHVFWPDGW